MSYIQCRDDQELKESTAGLVEGVDYVIDPETSTVYFSMYREVSACLQAVEAFDMCDDSAAV